MITIRKELAADVPAREALLDCAFSEARSRKTAERLRQGRLPAEGLSFVAEENERVVGTVRLWAVAAGPARPALLLGLKRRRVMNDVDPLPLKGSESALFLVGKDSHGNWVVQDQSGLCGGLFVGRAAALKFAMSENGNQPHAVIMVPGVFELVIRARPNAGHSTAGVQAPLQRVA